MCRVEGLYVRNNRLDEIINAKTVKCSMKSCKWTGALKHYPSHQHTTYSDERTAQSVETARTTELPTVQPTASTPSTSRPQSNSRSLSRPGALASSEQTARTSSDVPRRRQPLATNNANTQNPARSSSVSRSSNGQNTARSTNSQRTNRSTNGQSTSRTRTRSRNRQTSSTSPQRRSNVTATGLNPRLTSRARIQNDGTIENRPNNATTTAVTSQPSNITTDENENPSTDQTTTETIHVPRPPPNPRPVAHTPRRLPTLPNMLTTRNIEPLNTDNNNNVSSTESTSTTENNQSPRTFTITAVRRPHQRSFGTIRDRLNESRQRLDMLMSVFSTELDRGRQDLTSFQEERERRRQEQLAEVQNLGRRLTQVAQELRGLLSQRRQIRGQMDTLIQSASDDAD